MAMKVQEGIYYQANTAPRKSFCIMSLRTNNSCQIKEVGNSLRSVFTRVAKLRKGIIEELPLDSKHRKTGNLTVLLAYGAKVFDLPGSKKSRPAALADVWNFKPPSTAGGGELIDGSNISYSPRVTQNHLLFDQVLFQFIADDEFYTNRAIVEVWKELNTQKRAVIQVPLRITGIYPGFQREDQRSWLGFHDGISNLTEKERKYVIPINSRHLRLQDSWTHNGTFLAFMRIAIDLEKWEGIPRNLQEIVIGRDKLSGCPLIRVDKNMRPAKDSRCPVSGTSEIIDPGNEYFRDHIPYTSSPNNKILQASHIGSTRPRDQIPVWDKKSLRIYRQGFEFLESTTDDPGFVVGLNFVSFQNTPERLYRVLAYQNTISQRIASAESVPRLEQVFSVFGAGIFFVPPVVEYEPFPGAQIFFSRDELEAK